MLCHYLLWKKTEALYRSYPAGVVFHVNARVKPQEQGYHTRKHTEHTIHPTHFPFIDGRMISKLLPEASFT